MPRPHVETPMVHYSIFLPPEYLARLRKVAGENVTVSSLVRIAIKRFLEDIDNAPRIDFLGMNVEPSWIAVTPPPSGGVEEAADVVPGL